MTGVSEHIVSLILYTLTLIIRMAELIDPLTISVIHTNVLGESIYLKDIAHIM